MSEFDTELERLERLGTGLFRRAIAGDLATFDAFLENVDRLILLWPRIRRRAVSGGGPRQAEVMRARIAKLWEEQCRLTSQRDFLPPQERMAVDKRLRKSRQKSVEV